MHPSPVLAVPFIRVANCLTGSLQVDYGNGNNVWRVFHAFPGNHVLQQGDLQDDLFSLVVTWCSSLAAS
jgi:hypothetical protein